MSFTRQLSYSVNKVQSEVAVRVGEAGALEPQHAGHERVFRRKRLMKVEMQFLSYFFLLWKKSKMSIFSNKDSVGSKIFPALDLFVPFWGNLAKRSH
jgi:hypothetical protein